MINVWTTTSGSRLTKIPKMNQQGQKLPVQVSKEIIKLFVLYITLHNLIICFNTGQEEIPSHISDPFEGDEREAALAADPDLTDLDSDDWPTSSWIIPKGKLKPHLAILLIVIVTFSFLIYFSHNIISICRAGSSKRTAKDLRHSAGSHHRLHPVQWQPRLPRGAQLCAHFLQKVPRETRNHAMSHLQTNHHIPHQNAGCSSHHR